MDLSIDTTPKIPFANSYAQAKEFVAEKRWRPKIIEEVPHSIAKLIKKWWCDDPNDRLQSMEEVTDELLNIQDEIL